MTGRLHVIGAGVAGLATAVLAGRAGWPVTVHEAAPTVGGRCRTIERYGQRHDNGTHVVFTANRATLRLLRLVGVRECWVEPEPDGLPVVDLAAGRMHPTGLSPWSWFGARRPQGMRVADVGALVRLAGAPGDRPVAAFGTPSLAGLLDLMTTAVLNAPPDTASARLLAGVLRRLLVPGAAGLLVARDGLGPDLVEPLRRAAAEHGELRCGRRLRRLVVAEGRAVALEFGDQDVALGPDDRVVLALPPGAVADLLPSVAVPDRFAPIVNLHLPCTATGPVRFVGITGGLAQWLLVRPGMASVTVSAADAIVDLPAEAIIARVLPEVEAAARLAGVELGEIAAERAMVVKERRATPVQDCAHAGAGRPRLRPLVNVTLAGDWTSALPATIEAAIGSAEAAVRRLGRAASPAAGVASMERSAAA